MHGFSSLSIACTHIANINLHAYTSHAYDTHAHMNAHMHAHTYTLT